MDVFLPDLSGTTNRPEASQTQFFGTCSVQVVCISPVPQFIFIPQSGHVANSCEFIKNLFQSSVKIVA
jgi:hypothetical protein